MGSPREQWLEIEREAYDQVRAELAAVTAPALGDAVAWVDCRYGRTDALSAVHRVGPPLDRKHQHTKCGEVIPEPIRRIALNPALVRSLGRCKWCEALPAKQGVAA